MTPEEFTLAIEKVWKELKRRERNKKDKEKRDLNPNIVRERHKRWRDRNREHCRERGRANIKRRYAKEREKHLSQEKRKHMASPEKRMLIKARYRAKKKGLPFNLSKGDLQIPEVCPVFGFRLIATGERKDSPSLDRIIPSLGYVRGNVQVISTLANAMKFTATPEELLAFARWVAAQHGLVLANPAYVLAPTVA